MNKTICSIKNQLYHLLPSRKISSMEYRPTEPLLGFEEYRSAFLKSDPPWPEEVKIGLTNECPLKCIFCHHSMGRSPEGVLTERVWDEMCQVIARATEVNVSGAGEPLIYPRFVEALETIGAFGPSTILFTSMNFSSERHAEAIVNTVGRLNCSLEAATEDVYRTVRVGGDFNRVRKNVHEVVERRRKNGYSREQMEICIGFMPMNQNLHELRIMPDLIAELGADSLLIQPMFEIVRQNISSFRPERLEALREQIHLTSERCRELGVSFENPIRYLDDKDMITAPPAWVDAAEERNPGESTEQFPWQRPQNKKCILECTNSHRHIAIFPDGTVLPCFARYAPMGNVSKESFAEVWKGDRFGEYRRRMLTADCSPCRGCTHQKWVDEPTLGGLRHEVRPEEMTHLCHAIGWWDLERDNYGRYFRWTKQRASFFLPRPDAKSKIHIHGYLPPQTLRVFKGAPLEVRASNSVTRFDLREEGELNISLPSPEAKAPFIRVDIICPGTFSPKRDYGYRRDNRNLGIIFFGAVQETSPF